MLSKKIGFVLILCSLFCCGTPSNTDDEESPVVTPEASIGKMKVEEGFEVKLVAAEPLVNTPVAITFDARGRIWVVEMQGYMPDTVGAGEELPTGKIVILEDTDRDGVADVRKVFLDSLVLPRAICLIEDGVLVAEPPKLWYVKIENDTAGEKILVDSQYAEGGNVEHQPNGLLRALDNWIYNAKSSARYRKQGDSWLKERTHFRGQWGLSQDDYGRLFYNHNSANVLGDYFLPSLGTGNSNQQHVNGFNEKIVADNRVYPIHATTGVNRGYLPDFLDSSGRLVNFTAACGPLIYRGDLFDAAYRGNAFVPEPSANLVKRNILEENGYVVSGEQAYREKEFLASTDERFRPVNIYNGPDGALYLADMYRGIIQHKTYLTDYLKKQIRERELTQPLSCGRIYKIVPVNKKTIIEPLPQTAEALVKLFEHPNGWIRDKAQQLLIDGKHTAIVPVLRQYVQSTGKPLPLIHALYTLEGLGVLTAPDIIPLLSQQDWRIRSQAMALIPAVINRQNYRQFLSILQQYLQQNDSLAAPVIGYLVPAIKKLDKNAADKLLQTLIRQFPNDKYVADAVISTIKDKEAQFLATVKVIDPDTNLVINRRLQKVLADIKKSDNEKQTRLAARKYPEGMTVYKSACQTCHGETGNGMPSLAPPLNGSEWVTGDKEKLAAIVLYGLTGPIEVGGKLYAAPDISSDMPGIANNQALSDTAIASLLSFIRSAWGNTGSAIRPADIKSARQKHKGRDKPFTTDELGRLK